MGKIEMVIAGSDVFELANWNNIYFSLDDKKNYYYVLVLNIHKIKVYLVTQCNISYFIIKKYYFY